MYLKSLFALAFCFALSEPAKAQVGLGNSTGFCMLSPQELLVALEGTWSFDQGPGKGKAGTMDVPFPDQPPVPLKVEFLREVEIGFLSGQGQQMIILPMVPGLVDNWAAALPQADQEKYNKPGAGCDWKSLPSFIGTTDYVLGGTFNGKPPANLRDSKKFKASEISICGENPVYKVLSEGRVLTAEEKNENRDWFDMIVEAAGLPDELGSITCTDAYEIKKGGDMSMTIVARFESPTSGFGHVYFEGRTDRSRFSASAPLTLTK